MVGGLREELRGAGERREQEESEAGYPERRADIALRERDLAAVTGV